MTGNVIRLSLLILALAALAAGVLLVIFAGTATTEAFAPFGLLLAAAFGQHLPTPEGAGTDVDEP